MALRYQPMRREDIGKCVQLMATHPDFVPQYGSSSDLLRKAWLKQFGSDAFRGVVFEEICGAETRVFGVGVLVFVTDEFIEEAKRPPYFWLGPQLAARIVNGNSPVLSDKDVRRLNSTTGLNVVPWPLGCRTEDVKRVEVTSLAIGGFLEEVRGYRLKEFLAQSSVEEETLAMVGAGCTLAANGLEHTSLGREELKLLNQPYVIYLTREIALSSYGSWAGAMFVHEPARIGFARSQQRLLSAALQGGTDDELAVELQISTSTVKKSWLSIYARAEAADVGNGGRNCNRRQLADRGRERKRSLLTYVRAHPEELRPVDLKLVDRGERG